MSGDAVWTVAYLGTVFLLVAVGVLGSRRREMPDVLRRLSEDLDGRVFLGRRWQSPAVLFTLEGRPARLEQGRGAAIRVDVKGLSPGAMRVFMQRPADAVAKLFGGQDLTVGSWGFDALYVVKARPPALVREIFSAERRAEAMASLQGLEPHGEPRLDLGRQCLTIRVDCERPSRLVFMDLVRTARQWLQFLKFVKPVVDVVWIDEPAALVGQCQICGAGMSNRIVHCRKCGTPHHFECWQYMGVCSTFACGEKRHR